MSKNITMQQKAERYLKVRHDLGYQLKIEGPQLLRFAEYCDKNNHQGPVSTEIALRWATLPVNTTRLYWARRLEIVRCFAKYQSAIEPGTQIPPSEILGKAHRRTTPHIYSDKQLSEILLSASVLPSPTGLRAKSYKTLFGLLACTGMRISEALKLNRMEVDTKQDILTVTETKFRKNRLVPLDPSTNEILREYALFRDQIFPFSQTATFFVAESGKQLNYSTVRTTFKNIRSQYSWGNPPLGRRPRIYDLRHSFACKRLLKWYSDGEDVFQKISALSTYLGHAKTSDTYWYLTGIPELMVVAGRRFEQFVHDTQRGDQL